MEATMDTCAELAKEECQPCKGGTAPLEGKALKDLQERLGHGWTVSAERHLEKEFKFNDFAEALEFTNAVGRVAERHDHHPDIHLAWGKVGIELWTHKIDGLTETDFVMAAKFQGEYQG